MVAETTAKTPTLLPQSMWVDGELETSPLVLDFSPVLELMARLEYGEREIDRWLIEFNHANKELVGKLELNKNGELLVTPMLREEGSADELEFGTDLNIWVRQHGGAAHDSRLGIRMPSGDIYAPDAAWISPEQQANRPQPYPSPDDWLLPFCPAFVVEIRSRSDRLAPLQRKMADYVANGALLGWLIDPYLRQVHVYFPGYEPLVLDDPEILSGEPVLPGFVFDIRRRIFDREGAVR